MKSALPLLPSPSLQGTGGVEQQGRDECDTLSDGLRGLRSIWAQSTSP